MLDDVGVLPFLLNLETAIDRALALSIVDAQRLDAEKCFADAERLDTLDFPGRADRRVPEELPLADLSVTLKPLADDVRIVDTDDDDDDARDDTGKEAQHADAHHERALLRLPHADLTGPTEKAAHDRDSVRAGQCVESIARRRAPGAAARIRRATRSLCWTPVRRSRSVRSRPATCAASCAASLAPFRCPGYLDTYLEKRQRPGKRTTDVASGFSRTSDDYDAGSVASRDGSGIAPGMPKTIVVPCCCSATCNARS